MPIRKRLGERLMNPDPPSAPPKYLWRRCSHFFGRRGGNLGSSVLNSGDSLWLTGTQGSLCAHSVPLQTTSGPGLWSGEPLVSQPWGQHFVLCLICNWIPWVLSHLQLEGKWNPGLLSDFLCPPQGSVQDHGECPRRCIRDWHRGEAL